MKRRTAENVQEWLIAVIAILLVAFALIGCRGPDGYQIRAFGSQPEGASRGGDRVGMALALEWDEGERRQERIDAKEARSEQRRRAIIRDARDGIVLPDDGKAEPDSFVSTLDGTLASTTRHGIDPTLVVLLLAAFAALGIWIRFRPKPNAANPPADSEE